MRQTEEKIMTLEEKFNDYERMPVPASAQRTWFEQGMVWLGEGFGLSGLAVGGVLAEGLSFSDMLLVCIVGAFIVFVLASIVALIGAHTHLPTAINCRRAFGLKGAKLIGVIFCLCNFGWYAFQADLFGETIAALIKDLSGAALPTVMFTIIGGLAMAMTAVFGFKAIKKLSEIGVPLLFVLCAVAVVRTCQIIPASEVLTSGPTGKAISIPTGISVVVSSFAVGIVMMSDFSRFCKTPKDCVIGVSLGYFWGYVPVMVCGAFFTYAFKNWNVVEVMVLTLGLGIFGALVLVLGQWTTNDNNLYGSVLGLMNTLDGVSKIPRMKLTLLLGAVSTAIAALGVYRYFVNFLSILGVFIAPIAGILIADFYICSRAEYDKDIQDISTQFKWNAAAAWIVSSILGLTMTEVPVGLGWFVELGNIIPTPVICTAAAMVIYICGEKRGVTRNKTERVEM
jgi:cytosine permease